MDHGQIVEDATKDDFFGKTRSERAQQFLAKILQHGGLRRYRLGCQAKLGLKG